MSEKRTTGRAKKKKAQRSPGAEPRPYPKPRAARRSVREQSAATGTNWHRLRAMTDGAALRAALDDPDNLPSCAAWLSAGRLEVPVQKQPVSLRIDVDVLEWFKSAGPLYQTRMNDVLRAYVEFHTQRRK